MIWKSSTLLFHKRMTRRPSSFSSCYPSHFAVDSVKVRCSIFEEAEELRIKFTGSFLAVNFVMRKHEASATTFAQVMAVTQRLISMCCFKNCILSSALFVVGNPLSRTLVVSFPLLTHFSDFSIFTIASVMSTSASVFRCRYRR
jgi:hypothetical protein